MPARPGAGDQGRLPSIPDAAPWPRRSCKGQGHPSSPGAGQPGFHQRHFTNPPGFPAKRRSILTDTPGSSWTRPRRACPAAGKCGSRAGPPQAPCLPWEQVPGTPTWPTGHPRAGTGGLWPEATKQTHVCSRRQRDQPPDPAVLPLPAPALLPASLGLLGRGQAWPRHPHPLAPTARRAGDSGDPVATESSSTGGEGRVAFLPRGPGLREGTRPPGGPRAPSHPRAFCPNTGPADVR